MNKYHSKLNNNFCDLDFEQLHLLLSFHNLIRKTEFTGGMWEKSAPSSEQTANEENHVSSESNIISSGAKKGEMNSMDGSIF